MTDEQIEGMNELKKNENLFNESEMLALQYAECVTHDSRSISDDFFNRLKGAYSEEAIIEMTCVIGLFCYFNRFNNALKVDITR